VRVLDEAGLVSALQVACYTFRKRHCRWTDQTYGFTITIWSTRRVVSALLPTTTTSAITFLSPVATAHIGLWCSVARCDCERWDGTFSIGAGMGCFVHWKARNRGGLHTVIFVYCVLGRAEIARSQMWCSSVLKASARDLWSGVHIKCFERKSKCQVWNVCVCVCVCVCACAF
jgi:hypothetical protein